jgi:hypothetical protein
MKNMSRPLAGGGRSAGHRADATGGRQVVGGTRVLSLRRYVDFEALWAGRLPAMRLSARIAA